MTWKLEIILLDIVHSFLKNRENAQNIRDNFHWVVLLKQRLLELSSPVKGSLREIHSLLFGVLGKLITDSKRGKVISCQICLNINTDKILFLE